MGDAGLFFAAIIASMKDRPTVKGTVKMANLMELKMDCINLELENMLI